MIDSDRIAVQERYRKRWQEFGLDGRTLGWNKDCQWVRFEAAVELVRPEDMRSVLDVGCGFGDFLGFLRHRGWNGHYIGIDLVEEFTELARSVYKNDASATFLSGDLQTAAADLRTDAAVAIGIFNHKAEQGNLALVQETISTMWEVSNKLVVCDFLSNSADSVHRQDHLYYADPADILQIASDYSRRFALHHSYMPFEFQVKIWHEQAFEVSAPVFPPYRHLASTQTQRRIAPGKTSP